MKFYFIRKNLSYKKLKQIAQGLRVIHAESVLESKQHGSKMPLLTFILYCLISTSSHHYVSPERETCAWQVGSSVWKATGHTAGLARVDTHIWPPWTSLPGAPSWRAEPIHLFPSPAEHDSRKVG